MLSSDRKKEVKSFSLFGMPSASIVSKILEKWSIIIERETRGKKNHLQYAST